jgi:hypothetical protein
MFFVHADAEFGPQLIKDICTAVADGHQWGAAAWYLTTSAIFRLIAGYPTCVRDCSSSCYGDQDILVRNLFYAVGKYPQTPFWRI